MTLTEGRNREREREKREGKKMRRCIYERVPGGEIERIGVKPGQE